MREIGSRPEAGRPFVAGACMVRPDRSHRLWTLPEADLDLSTRWRLARGCCVARLTASARRPPSVVFWRILRVRPSPSGAAFGLLP